MPLPAGSTRSVDAVRTVYLGTSGFAAAVLRMLAASPHRPLLVVTRPDAPFGRGRRLTPPPVAQAARELGIDVVQPASVNTDAAVAQILAPEPEALCVCAFGALIKEPLLSAAPILNVHPSLLPRWRGAAPVERAIIAGDTETGVSIMRLTAGLDSGPVGLQERVAIGSQDDYGTVAHTLEQLGGRLLIEALSTAPPFAEQPEDGVTYAEKITAQDRGLDPDAGTAQQLHDRIRALAPHIGAYLQRPDGSRLGVLESRVIADLPGLGHGQVEAGPGRLLLGCRQGALELRTVQPPGKRPMPAADYLRGLRR